MSITERIDKRIVELEKHREQLIESDEFVFANQTWARIQELKSLKLKYSDKEGNWLI